VAASALGADIRGPFFYFYSCVRDAAAGLEAFGDMESPNLSSGNFNPRLEAKLQ
jgi:hypothetical protein